MKTHELISLYSNKDEYSYVKTICEELEKLFPEVVIVHYDHLIQYQEHFWIISGIPMTVENINLVGGVFKSMDDTMNTIGANENTITIIQRYEK